MSDINPNRMIPLHVADQAVAACEKEIQELRAEVERLTAEKDQAECDYDNCQKRKVSIDNHRFDLFTENKNLKAEVERLRIAGGESEPRFVFLSDYRHLKAERDTLKAEVKRLSAADSYLQDANEHAFEKRCDELEAEVERLTAMANECEHLHKGIYSLSLNVVQLNAEVERLRKAGDAMAMTLQADYNGVPYEPHVIINAIIYWLAAKEGKPSV